ncbi:hypothetical protein QYE76_071536 [Lolium multiflorum]|uniref:Transposon protein, putative, CACTA, En/Spm sub-class n=1 Tax=Lolium multiflorum TaxID=4521 RepID=A0AAD8WEP6_LOLMU|nr:hypothetical protein QYE76_071536 [Lolium multiflorum]
MEAEAGICDKPFEKLLKIMKMRFPKDNELPDSTYEAKKVLFPLGLEVLKIHACINDCILYRAEYENLEKCPVCTALRYKIRRDDPGDVEGEPPRKRVPAKVMWYAPIIPRLKRLFRNKEHARLLQWHKEDRKKDEMLRHPADGSQWRKIDREFPDFADDARNLRFHYILLVIEPDTGVVEVMDSKSKPLEAWGDMADILHKAWKRFTNKSPGLKNKELRIKHVPDPLYPEGHPKRVEQDSQLTKTSAPSKKKKKKHKNVVESSEPVNDPNSISISDAETESGNEHEEDNDKNDTPDKEEIEKEPEKPAKNKKYTKEDFIAEKHGAVIDCNKGMVTFNVDDKEHTVYFPKRIDKKRKMKKFKFGELFKKGTTSTGILDDFFTLVNRAGLATYVGDEREQYYMLTKIFVESFKFHNTQYEPTVAFKIYDIPVTMELEEFCRALDIAPVDGNEGNPSSQPGLFSIDRQSWSLTKEEVEEHMKIQEFHQQHDSENAEPSYDCTVTYPDVSSSTSWNRVVLRRTTETPLHGDRGNELHLGQKPKLGGRYTGITHSLHIMVAGYLYILA